MAYGDDDYFDGDEDQSNTARIVNNIFAQIKEAWGKIKVFANKHIDIVTIHNLVSLPTHSTRQVYVEPKMTLSRRLKHIFALTYPHTGYNFQTKTYFGQHIDQKGKECPKDKNKYSFSTHVLGNFVLHRFSIFHPAVSFFGFPSVDDGSQPQKINPKDEGIRPITSPTALERLKAFVGWPKARATSIAFYVLTGGPLTRIPFNIIKMTLTTLVSIAKIFTEILPTVAQSFSALGFQKARQGYMRNITFKARKDWENYAKGALCVLGMFVFGTTYYISKYIKIIGRTATSPIKSFKIGWDKHPILGVFSGLLTIALAVITLPFAIKAAILLGGPKVAAALTLAGEKLMASSVFAQIGAFFASTLPGALSVQLSTLAAAISISAPPVLLGLKELLSKISFKLAVHDPEPPTETTADSPRSVTTPSHGEDGAPKEVVRPSTWASHDMAKLGSAPAGSTAANDIEEAALHHGALHAPPPSPAEVPVPAPAPRGQGIGHQHSQSRAVLGR